jgi:hypothetical protein
MAINFDHQRDRISSSSQSITVNTTGAFTIPVGNTAQRPTAASGQIRFNSQQQAFEGYNGAGWSTLGGVRDVDGNTYVIAETSPGVNNNELDFFTDGTQRMQIGATGDFKFGDTLAEVTIAGATGNTVIGGTLDVTGITNINDVTDSTTTTDGALVVDGGVGIAKKLFVGTDLDVAGNVQIDGTLTVDGIATFKAGSSGSIAIGDDATDNVVFNADVNSDFVPDTNGTYNLGSLIQNWNTVFLRTLDSDTDIISVDINGALVLPVGTILERPATAAQGMIRYNSEDTTFEGYDGTAWGSLGGVKDVDQDTYIQAETAPGADNDELDFYTGGVERMSIGATGQITAAAGYTPTNPQDLITKDFAENNIQATAGTPTDSSWQDGAYLGFTDADKVADVLDELNESLENVRNNTFVRSVTFTGTPTSGGAGTSVTLNLVVDGTANRYDIDWGDGTNTNGVTTYTPSHVYASNIGSPYTVVVRAYNNSAISGSAGSEASSTRTDYIIIYTANPVAAFELYRASSGGTALTGNDLYVIEGNDLHMRNITTNTTMADVTYNIDWGDSSSQDSIANDSAAGGVSGTRLPHTWGAGTSSGTGRDTLTLTLNSHTTADPAAIPSSATLQLKVYDPNIATPDGLSTKTILFANDEGSSPKLASGFTDLTGGTSLSAGNNVDLSNNTSGQLETSVISTYAYNADAGTLTALVNGSADGTVTFTNADNAGTYSSLVVTDEEDYNLLNSSGSSTSFNSSIYHPGLYTGFKAKISKAANAISAGVNSFQLSHDATGDTNTVEFVKDNITSVPTVTAGTVSENSAGTYRYISGIPYYNSGSPSLTLSGVTVDSFIGQAYRDTTSVVNVTSGSNLESTSQSSIGNQNYTYAQIDGTSSFLTGGIPNADTGNGIPYTLGDLTVNITSSNVRTVENIRHRSNNIYGASSYQAPSEIIQVHTASQTGISEIAIDVSSSLGSTFNDDAVRAFDFSSATTDNPTIPAATNFYTNNVYSELADPGVAGTKEATIRLGVIEHNVNDYSTGYLPTGPDRSGDTGTQYITIAFRRSVVANFNINITSTTGVSGVWIAAPGTTIDNTSTINGWLDCGTQYGGAGVPGANIGNGGNGSDGCASTGGDIIATNTALSGAYTMTLGTENLTNAFDNVALVRIALSSNQKITALSIT